MAYSEEVKQEAIRRMKKGDETIKDISAELGISKQTLYNWRREDSKKGQFKEEQEEIVKEKIKQLIEKKEFKKAIIITEEYPNSVEIQNLRIEIAIRQINR